MGVQGKVQFEDLSTVDESPTTSIWINISRCTYIVWRVEILFWRKGNSNVDHWKSNPFWEISWILKSWISSLHASKVNINQFKARQFSKWAKRQNCHPNRQFARMKLSLSRYRSMLLVQISLLVVDLLINTFCEYLRFESVILLVVFVWVQQQFFPFHLSWREPDTPTLALLWGSYSFQWSDGAAAYVMTDEIAIWTHNIQLETQTYQPIIH